MQPAADVVYRDLDASQALNDIISKKLEKLSRFSHHIQRSRVVLDSPHKHKHKGKRYRASIELDLKGAPVTVSQDDTSIHIAVREAFNAAERKLKEMAARRRSARHQPEPADTDQPD
ncbi:ribosome-associated translation inhibitor RaiA [Exilibacterium tricleocarpae]|uniref:Ribosome-associated translation inhibitor RaiA n=1 Tax=Exilibacterium tricleocarpae TaxID=2591008 RepID=A0A545T868_9GAMM|nr:HPF/RaiA family ribosome-associated protein [Exilibacterium tricleocarpae]TQV73427.1 ribosome-associated translation inhibitor RaiA [Exilibacterium tricleocarpae]